MKQTKFILYLRTFCLCIYSRTVDSVVHEIIFCVNYIIYVFLKNMDATCDHIPEYLQKAVKTNFDNIRK